jgi:hypothetical protein
LIGESSGTTICERMPGPAGRAITFPAEAVALRREEVVGVLEVVLARLRDGVAFLRGLGELQLERHAAFLADVREDRVPVLRGQPDGSLVQHVEAVRALRHGVRAMQRDADCRGED